MSTKQLSMPVFNKYMRMLQTGASMSKRDLTALKSAVNMRASFSQLNMLLDASINCNCVVDGTHKLVGFESKQSWDLGTEFMPILVPIERPETKLGLEKATLAS